MGYRLRRSMRLPARGFITLGAIQAFLVLLFRYGDTGFPQPPASDLGGQTFLQPMVVALDMLITVVALPSLVLWVAIKWIIERRRMKPKPAGAPVGGYTPASAGKCRNPRFRKNPVRSPGERRLSIRFVGLGPAAVSTGQEQHGTAPQYR